jgi:hypothetical protein
MRLGAEACLFEPVDDFSALVDTVGSAFGKIERWSETLARLASHNGLAAASVSHAASNEGGTG